jgi:polysaccharide chain length determinant protein (PEP-CTERM system associated)
MHMDIGRDEIIKYLTLINRRKYLFALIVFPAVTIIAWVSFFLPNEYEARSTIFVEKNVIEDLVKGLAISPSMAQRVKVLETTMMSRGLIQRVLDDLGLIDPGGEDAENNQLIKKYQKALKIRDKDKNLFIISIQDQNPQTARDFINTLIRKYVEENISAKKAEAIDAGDFLSQQAEHFRRKLDEAEDKIVRFRQEKGIYLAMDDRSVIEEIRKHQGELETLEARERELAAMRGTIQLQIREEKPFSLAITEGGDSVELLEHRLRQLLLEYTENYPEVVMLKAQIEERRRQQDQFNSGEEAVTDATSGITMINPVYQEMKQELIKIDSELSAIDARMAYLESLIQDRERTLRFIPEGQKELNDLHEEEESYRSIYDQLLFRLGQSEVSTQMEIEDKATTFRIIEPAVLPQKPRSPNRIRIMLVGVILSFPMGFGGVWLRESVDNSVKDASNLENLGIEVLGVIPKIVTDDLRRELLKRDKLLYFASGICVLQICLLLAHEVLGLAYIQNMISQLIKVG